jgi:hypothetical protein
LTVAFSYPYFGSQLVHQRNFRVLGGSDDDLTSQDVTPLSFANNNGRSRRQKRTIEAPVDDGKLQLTPEAKDRFITSIMQAGPGRSLKISRNKQQNESVAGSTDNKDGLNYDQDGGRLLEENDPGHNLTHISPQEGRSEMRSIQDGQELSDESAGSDDEDTDSKTR